MPGPGTAAAWVAEVRVEGVLVVVVTIAVPAMLAGSMRLIDGLATWDPPRWRHRPEPSGPPVERLAADLHRLAVHLDMVVQSNQPAKAERLAAASAAYDDALLQAARVLEVPAADHGPLRPLDRLETEAELARAGLSW